MILIITHQIKILQENGEVVCCVGSALNSANMSIFGQANVSFAIEPLLRRCHNRDRDTSVCFYLFYFITILLIMVFVDLFIFVY